MLKPISLTLLSTVALATVAFAAEPAAPPPAMASGMFVDGKGMTLYVFDKDTPGKSNCNGPCAKNWPPLIVADEARPNGDWTIVVRDDGLKQWAYKMRPVYTWTKDGKPGDTTGDGFLNGAWHVAKP